MKEREKKERGWTQVHLTGKQFLFR
jgi:hypothetical protein